MGTILRATCSWVSQATVKSNAHKFLYTISDVLGSVGDRFTTPVICIELHMAPSSHMMNWLLLSLKLCSEMKSRDRFLGVCHFGFSIRTRNRSTGWDSMTKGTAIRVCTPNPRRRTPGFRVRKLGPIFVTVHAVNHQLKKMDKGNAGVYLTKRNQEQDV
jgi:hypothetical protein